MSPWLPLNQPLGCLGCKMKGLASGVLCSLKGVGVDDHNVCLWRARGDGCHLEDRGRRVRNEAPEEKGGAGPAVCVCDLLCDTNPYCTQKDPCLVYFKFCFGHLENF